MALGTKIVALRRLDLFRDRGSVVATFEGADGIEYGLFFGIAQRATERTLRRYRPPLLRWGRTAEYRSPVTGDTSPVLTKDSEPVTWDEARRILDELKPFYDAGACDDRGVFAKMLDAAAKNGRQPD